MNKWTINILFLVIVSALELTADKNVIKFDGKNVEEILRNTNLINSYIYCLTGRGRCTAGGSELKKILPDMLQTRCKSCTIQQKAGASRIIAYITANRPGTWREVQAKYDPEGLYAKRLKQQGLMHNRR